MADERGVNDIRREIEQARVSLAQAVDELAYRTNPQRVRQNMTQALRAKAQTPQGQAVIASVGGLFVLLVVRRVRRRKR